MKQMEKTSFVSYLFALILMGMVTACEKDIYNPDNDKGKLPPKEDYFPFNMKGDVQLDINYNAPGMENVIEIYTEYPLEIKNASYVKKDGITPVFAAFTKDGKLSTKLNVATASKELYLYTKRIGLPTCVKLTPDATGNYSYTGDDTQPSTRSSATTRAGVDLNGNIPYKVTGNNTNVYALYDWDFNAVPIKGALLPKAPIADADFNALITRAQNFLDENKKGAGNNENFVLGDGKTNLIIPAGGSTVNVTYIGSAGAYPSVFGYYYYQKGTTPNVKILSKYVLFANTHSAEGHGGIGVRRGQTAELLYFGGETPSKTFPEGTVVGWFFIAKGSFASGGNSSYYNNISTIEDTESVRNTSYSNDNKTNCQFVSLYDAKTKALVVGVEDLFGILESYPQFGKSDRDFDDLMFFVSTNPGLDNPGDLPEIDDKPESAEYEIKGTVAFEDIWPQGGDYDLNDVIIEYDRKVIVGKNNIVTKVTETFKPVHPAKSALQDNYFACQFKSPGKMTLPVGVILEQATNSIVIEASALGISGNVYVIERDLTGLNLTSDDLNKDFNPYIITKKYTTENRIEVHLPLGDMTSATDSKLMTKENAYYISADGIYPYAIDIPITGFVPADERIKIDAEGQYPNFAKWAKSKGEDFKDWYIK